MPAKLITETNALETSDTLLTQTGELTLEAAAVSDFLTHADFSQVFEHPAMQESISTVAKDGKITFGKNADQDAVREAAEGLDDEQLAEGEVVQILPIQEALKVIDGDDLDAMFAHYAESQFEAIAEDKRTLEDKARITAVAKMFGLTEFARGAFRKIRRRAGGGALVNRMIGAIMNKGQIKRVAKGSGYKGGDYDRTGRYKNAPRKSDTARIGRYKKANVGKVKKAALAARRAKKHKNESDENVGVPVFGLAVPFEGTVFEVAVMEYEAPADAEDSKGKEGLLRVEGISTHKPGHELAAAASRRKAVDESTGRGKVTQLSEGARLAVGMQRVRQLTPVGAKQD